MLITTNYKRQKRIVLPMETSIVNAGKAVKSKIAREAQTVDTRMTRFLPAGASVGGINLAPGVYSFTVNYYSGNSIINSKRFENYNAEAGKLNLVEDFYLKYNEVLPPLVLPAESENSDSSFYIRTLRTYMVNLLQARDQIEVREQAFSSPEKIPDNITFLRSFFNDGNIGTNLPNFPGRLPAPDVKVSHVRDRPSGDETIRIYNVTWASVPNAYRYYVYWVYDGNSYLTWVASGNALTLAMPSSFPFQPEFRVMAVGPDGFGVPSRIVRP